MSGPEGRERERERKRASICDCGRGKREGRRGRGILIPKWNNVIRQRNNEKGLEGREDQIPIILSLRARTVHRGKYVRSTVCNEMHNLRWIMFQMPS